MNKNDAQTIAETITNEQLQKMFATAKSKITDWEVVSIVSNKLTKGVAWNILASNFNVNVPHSILAKTNMIREYGEFLPKALIPVKKPLVRGKQSLTHQEPKFNEV